MTGCLDASRSHAGSASQRDDGGVVELDDAGDRGRRAVSAQDLARRAVPLAPIVGVAVGGDVQPEDRDDRHQRDESAGAAARGARAVRHGRRG